MAEVWIDVPGLTSVGTKVRDAATVAMSAKDELATGESAAAGTALPGFEAKAALAVMFETWVGTAAELGDAVETTGDKLVTTANVYSSGDQMSAGEFAQVSEMPWYAQPA